MRKLYLILMILIKKQLYHTLLFCKTGVYRFSASQNSAKQVIESYWEVQQKIEILAELILKAKYPIFFTGAGISTSIGIPDYRSGQDTVLKTGPGLWNRQPAKTNQPLKPYYTPIDKLVDVANPSLTHMFISTLLNRGIFKHLVSQNTDGMHLRSGISLDMISELHGNRNLEHCRSCERKYLRDFRTLRRDGKEYKPGEKRDHFTGRYCQNCEGELHDSIIYFGQKLPRQELVKAYYHASKADLCICIGSSLTVKPSSLVPLQTVKKGGPGKICIVNIQETPLDQAAELKINYFCDDVFDLLARKMNVAINKLKIEHFLEIQLTQHRDEINILRIRGKDQDGNNLTFMNRVQIIQENEIKQAQISGHFCQTQISSLPSPLNIKITHFGDKQQFNFSLSPDKLALNQPLRIKYSKEEGQEWIFQYF